MYLGSWNLCTLLINKKKSLQCFYFAVTLRKCYLKLLPLLCAPPVIGSENTYHYLREEIWINIKIKYFQKITKCINLTKLAFNIK